MQSIRSRLPKIDLHYHAGRIRRIGREFLWVAIGQALAAAGGLVGVRLMTHALEPQAYGELALGLATAILVQQSVLAPLSSGGLRFFASAEERRSLSAFFAAMWKLLRNVTLLLFLAAALIIAAIAVGDGRRWLVLSIAAFLFSLLAGYAVILDGFQNAARQRIIVAFHDALNQWGRFLIAFALTMLVAHTSAMAMTGYAIGAAVVLASQAFFFRKYVQVRIRADHESNSTTSVAEWQLRIQHYAWPIGTWGVFYWAQAASDRWALDLAKSTSDVGLYAVVYQLGYYPIALLSGLVIQLVSPIVFARAGDATEAVRLQRSRRLNQGVLAIVVALTLIAVLAAAALHRWIFALFAAPSYHRFSVYLPWMILAGGIFAAGQVGSLSIMAGGETRRLLRPRIVTALLGVALNFAGAFAFGVEGVIGAVIITNGAFLVWVLWLAADEASRPTLVASPSQESS